MSQPAKNPAQLAIEGALRAAEKSLTEQTGSDDSRGMQCPHCASTFSHVTHSRPLPRGRIRRYRECRHCGRRYTTIEVGPWDAAQR